MEVGRAGTAKICRLAKDMGGISDSNQLHELLPRMEAQSSDHQDPEPRSLTQVDRRQGLRTASLALKKVNCQLIIRVCSLSSCKCHECFLQMPNPWYMLFDKNVRNQKLRFVSSNLHDDALLFLAATELFCLGLTLGHR